MAPQAVVGGEEDETDKVRVTLHFPSSGRLRGQTPSAACLGWGVGGLTGAQSWGERSVAGSQRPEFCFLHPHHQCVSFRGSLTHSSSASSVVDTSLDWPASRGPSPLPRRGVWGGAQLLCVHPCPFQLLWVLGKTPDRGSYAGRSGPGRASRRGDPCSLRTAVSTCHFQNVFRESGGTARLCPATSLS